MAESDSTATKRSLPERLQAHPELWARVEQLLDIVEGRGAELVKASEAERQVGEQLQQLGQDALQVWAAQQHARQCQYWGRRAGLTRKEKKGSTGTPAMDA